MSDISAPTQNESGFGERTIRPLGLAAFTFSRASINDLIRSGVRVIARSSAEPRDRVAKEPSGENDRETVPVIFLGLTVINKSR
jgi:hypothetical protein